MRSDKYDKYEHDLFHEKMLGELRRLKFPSEKTIAKLVRDVKKYVTPSCDPSDAVFSDYVHEEEDCRMGGISLWIKCDGTRSSDNWGFQHSAPYKGNVLADHDWTAKKDFYDRFEDNRVRAGYDDSYYGDYLFVVRKDSDPDLSAKEILQNLKPHKCATT